MLIYTTNEGGRRILRAVDRAGNSIGVCVPRMCGVTVQWAETKPQRKGQRQ